jgi:hypothetical protein
MSNKCNEKKKDVHRISTDLRTTHGGPQLKIVNHLKEAKAYKSGK